MLVDSAMHELGLEPSTRLISVIFEKEKDTKNTVRFKERDEGTPQAIGTLYIQKDVLKSLGNPRMVRVRIEPLS